MPEVNSTHPDGGMRPPLPRRCRAAAAPRRKAPDTWPAAINGLRHDLLVVQMGAARLAAGDELAEADLDALGLAALHVYEVLEAVSISIKKPTKASEARVGSSS